ncbi:MULTISPECIES: alpha/beta hydrolase [Pseudomonas]|uniref:alpha/beta fold hydrolase n=1 Tax=Pseudomonas TaxID=286 RepID=UPI000299F29B|nr:MULTISPECIES: alpha/beta hydrolase [Pseudomonas]MBS7600577.1 alpha/beta hydrolase [Pseudomonas sp. RC2C2]MCP6696338.1 alpha/beta hydrolase [Pseudomonas donghuensis]QHF28117.1 alpha/beta hydrolase [Pseudomonas sp. R32]UVL26332.1 alpha/beta hydrolase [Pseudomonas donghuensis]
MTAQVKRAEPSGVPSPSYIDTPTRSVTVGSTAFAYRDLGPRSGVPLILLNHWGAVLDNFDPRIVDGLARTRRVIAIDYRGIGASGGTAPVTIDGMARDVIELSKALGLNTVDLLGFSLGGFVAQDIVLKAPERVRRLILTGTGPAGGIGIEQVAKVSWPLMLKGLLTLRDPKTYLFFTSTANGRLAARAFLQRLKERKSNRDKGPTPYALLRQLKAIKAWGRQAPQSLDRIRVPVLIANGDQDIMVPTENSHDMARRIPGAQLVIYNDAGHGGIFQYHSEFVHTAQAFLEAQPESIGAISSLSATETMK